MEELLSLPIVKTLGLTREKIEDLIQYVRENEGSLWSVREQNLGGIELAQQLGLDEHRWARHNKELCKLFERLTKIAWNN